MKGKIVNLPRPAEPSAEVSDAALIAACGLGDTAALGVLFDRHQRGLERFIARLAPCDADELADLVQMTFIELHRSASRFQGRSSVKTWIYGIAANCVRHHVRGEVRRRAMLADVSARPHVSRSVPDVDAAHRQLVAQVGAALAALPPAQREVLVMVDLEEISGVEAARALGIREGTLWWRLHEARKALRAAVEGGSR